MPLVNTYRLRPYLAGLLLSVPLLAAPQQTQETGASGGGDIPKTFTAPAADYDYVRREVMIPMRDGVRLHTVILVPKSARDAPILLTRTPYNASKRASRNHTPHMLAAVPQGIDAFAADGYICVFQDVRGKYLSLIHI